MGGKGSTTSTPVLDPALEGILSQTAAQIHSYNQAAPLTPFSTAAPEGTAGLSPSQLQSIGTAPQLYNANAPEALAMNQYLHLGQLAGAGPVTGSADFSGGPSLSDIMSMMSTAPQSAQAPTLPSGALGPVGNPNAPNPLDQTQYNPGPGPPSLSPPDGGGGHGGVGSNPPGHPILTRHSGGNVPRIAKSDTVPAMLTPGEMVVPVKDVPEHEALAHREGLPGFGHGGLVGKNVARGLHETKLPMSWETNRHIHGFAGGGRAPIDHQALKAQAVAAQDGLSREQKLTAAFDNPSGFEAGGMQGAEGLTQYDPAWSGRSWTDQSNRGWIPQWASSLGITPSDFSGLSSVYGSTPPPTIPVTPPAPPAPPGPPDTTPNGHPPGSGPPGSIFGRAKGGLVTGYDDGGVVKPPDYTNRGWTPPPQPDPSAQPSGPRGNAHAVPITPPPPIQIGDHNPDTSSRGHAPIGSHYNYYYGPPNGHVQTRTPPGTTPPPAYQNLQPTLQGVTPNQANQLQGAQQQGAQGATPFWQSPDIQQAQQSITGTSSFSQQPDLLQAEQYITGNQIANDPTVGAMQRNFQNMVAPEIQNQAVLSGLGNSSATTNALAQAEASMLIPEYQNATQLEQQRQQNILGTMQNVMGRGQQEQQNILASIQNELALRQHVADQQAQYGLAEAQGLQGLGAQQYGQLQGAIGEGAQLGGTEQQNMQSAFQNLYNDLLRRQGLSEQAVYAPFGRLSATGTNTQTSK